MKMKMNLIKNYLILLMSPLFDSKWYLNRYKDVAEARANPILHYLNFGWKEGRDPSGLFSTSLYLRLRPDVGEAGICPLVHYETCGKREIFVNLDQKLNELSSIKEKVKSLQTELSNQRGQLNAIQDIFLFVNSCGINKEKASYEMERFKGNGTSEDGESKDVVVSLTSYPERMYDIHYTLYSLLMQTMKPGRIILWLGKEKFPNGDEDLPQKVLSLKRRGLSIEYTEDEKAYTKLIPALKEYGDKVIVTADDDIFYQEDWLERLYSEHKRHGDCVVCHRAHKIAVEDGKILPYSEWPRSIADASESFLNFLTGVGGVLYPPGILHKDVLDKSLYTALTPMNDDIWFWAMAVLKGKKIRVVENPANALKYTNPQREKKLSGETTLYSQNISQNDEQIANVINHYPEIKSKIGLN